jgi:tol-pal system protein YbgF
MASLAEDGWVAVGQAPAAKPAVQSANNTNSRNLTSSVPKPTASSAIQLELLSMVEAMQQEIAELRGTVEEQNHTIEMLKKQQQQRYLDLDRRVSELLQSPAKPQAKAAAAVTSDGVLPADDLYASAMAAVKKKDFASALAQLDLFAKNYPQHALAGNALYWSGEVELAEGNFEVAIKQFLVVVNNHPKHNKVPDSHYKLAVAYDRSGKTDKAKETLDIVIKQYKGVSDSVVRLAERYLSRLEGAK